MNFTSDNCYGVAPEILAALARENGGAQPSYGDDAASARLTARLSQVFEREVAVFPVISGTAANALALAALVPPHGAILAHKASHISTDECAAVESFTHGAKLVTLEGANGKLEPHAIAAALAAFRERLGASRPARGDQHHAGQRTGYGLCRAGNLGDCADRSCAGPEAHMDGARFANALAHLKCAPADISWRAGVDVLSFGATKNGAMGAEAVIFFDPAGAADFVWRRKKAGHLISKMRFVSAQLEAYLADDLWLRNATRANALATRLADGMDGDLAWPVQANEVFARVSDAVAARLRAAGASFYDWSPSEGGRTLIRLVTSFATREEDVEKLIALARDT